MTELVQQFDSLFLYTRKSKLAPFSPPVSPTDELADDSESRVPPSCPIRFVIGYHCKQGYRPEMEDEHVIEPHLHPIAPDGSEFPQSYGYFAVFDGHSGADAAKYAATELHVQLAREIGASENPTSVGVKQALQNAFMRTDSSFLSQREARGWRGGSTAIVTLITGNTLYVAGAGDSRAMLCLADGTAAQLSRDHRPDHPEERERIEKEGGFVEHKRVNGSLAMSRSLGDAKYKQDGVIATPDVYRYKLTPKATALVIACDGLWDYVPQRDVSEFVVECVKRGFGPEAIAQEMCRAAIQKYRSMDNVTVVVVLFDWKNTPGTESYALNKVDLTEAPVTPQAPILAPRGTGG